MKVNRVIALMLIAILFVSMLAGCASKGMSEGQAPQVAEDNTGYSQSDGEMTSTGGGVPYPTDMAKVEEPGLGDNAFTNTTNTSNTNLMGQTSSNKIIYGGDLSLGTADVTKLQQEIIAKVQSMGGYIQSSYEEQFSAGLVVRVPQNKFFEFMNSEIFKGQEVDRKSISSEDVTLRYSNVTAELESLRIQEQRLLDYLKSAKTVKDMLEIENQLSSVRLGIKTAEETKKAMDSYIDMSEVNINIYSRTNEPVANENLLSRIGYAFENTGYQIKRNFDNFIVGLITFIPTLINLIVLAVVAIIIYKNRKRFLRNSPNKLFTKKDKIEKRDKEQE